MQHKDLKRGQVISVCPTIVEGRMSGAVFGYQNKRGLVMLHYEDGTTETADLGPDFELDDESENAPTWFSIVGRVQALRPNTVLGFAPLDRIPKF